MSVDRSTDHTSREDVSDWRTRWWYYWFDGGTYYSLFTSPRGVLFRSTVFVSYDVTVWRHCNQCSIYQGVGGLTLHWLRSTPSLVTENAGLRVDFGNILVIYNMFIRVSLSNKMPEKLWVAGFTPDPTGGAYNAPRDPLAGGKAVAAPPQESHPCCRPKRPPLFFFDKLNTAWCLQHYGKTVSAFVLKVSQLQTGLLATAPYSGARRGATFLPHKRDLHRHAVFVRLSVCPSVTFVNSVKTSSRIFGLISRSQDVIPSNLCTICTSLKSTYPGLSSRRCRFLYRNQWELNSVST